MADIASRTISVKLHTARNTNINKVYRNIKTDAEYSAIKSATLGLISLTTNSYADGTISNNYNMSEIDIEGGN